MKTESCLFYLEQIEESHLLSPARMDEIKAAVDAAFEPVFLKSGQEVSGVAFVRTSEDKGQLFQSLDQDHMRNYARREALRTILTHEELQTINQHCLTATSARLERERFEKAEKLTTWDGGVFWGDDYYADVDAALEAMEDLEDDERPDYLWTADPSPVVPELGTDIVTDYLIENHGWDEMDETDFDGVPALAEALKAFAARNADLKVFHPNHKRCVLLTAE